MDIEKQVAELKAKHWDVSCVTSYVVQQRSVNGDHWYLLGTFDSLDKAIECEMEHFNKWFSKCFESPEQVESLRIIMRHVVEVVL